MHSNAPVADVLRPGLLLRDNDPHNNHRVLTIESVETDDAGVPTKVIAREGAAPDLVNIAVGRIYTDHGIRSSGFSALLSEQLDPALRALVGYPILLNRGSTGHHEGPGCHRQVRARLDWIAGNTIFATLLQDDPMATVAPTKSGESGSWHGLSFIAGPMPAPELSLEGFELLRQAVNLARECSCRTKEDLMARLRKGNPGAEAAIEEAVAFWVLYRSRPPIRCHADG